MKYNGKLTVFCGPMFSGKSSELLRMGERHTLAKQNVVYIKPSMDTRYSEDEIVTHAGKFVKAISVNVAKQIVDNKEVTNADVILIDEIQFFESNIVVDLVILLAQGKTIYVSGLDMDFQGQPFPITVALMGVADEVHKQKAVCEMCGQDAPFSFRTNSNKEKVQLGEKDSYIPVCRNCFTIRQVIGR